MGILPVSKSRFLMKDLQLGLWSQISKKKNLMSRGNPCHFCPLYISKEISRHYIRLWCFRWLRFIALSLDPFTKSRRVVPIAASAPSSDHQSREWGALTPQPFSFIYHFDNISRSLVVGEALLPGPWNLSMWGHVDNMRPTHEWGDGNVPNTSMHPWSCSKLNPARWHLRRRRRLAFPRMR